MRYNIMKPGTSVENIYCEKIYIYVYNINVYICTTIHQYLNIYNI